MAAPLTPEIQSAYEWKFTDDFITLSQQQGARLEGIVRIDADQIEAKQAVFDRMGAVAPQKRTSLHEPTPLIHTPYSRRVAILETWVWADIVDPMSAERMMKNPRNRLVQSATWSFGRQTDDVIIAAAVGNARAMDPDDVIANVPLPAAQVIGDGTEVFTLGTWLDIKQKMDAAEVPDFGRSLWVSSFQLRQMLDDDRLTSRDYNNVQALVNGQVNDFLGFQVIRTERIPVAAGVRDVIACGPGGIGFIAGDDMLTRVTERNDLNHGLQFWMQRSMGAVRIEEVQVVVAKVLDVAPS
ncbi:hypothetical protein J4558_00035 [Leptolyngbya sp. 15MV]|nr:hypothetical protein J4558_00035 [Leptolyngbya sp. 15MV]